MPEAQTAQQMPDLVERIRRDGRNLGNGILKVDSFMNHQLDPLLMKNIGKEFARHFADTKPTRIVTAETSGIAPALSAAMVLEVPLVFARKHRPVTMSEPLQESAPSHTKGGIVNLMISPEYLHPDDRVLIIDDFLASARTIEALANLVIKRGSTLVGIGAVIEKVYSGGRAILTGFDVPIISLARIERLSEDGIVFSE
jgi:xanthine phosphoribosyltransferase